MHCREEFLAAAAIARDESASRLHTHLGESKIQAVSGPERYGKH